MGLVASLEITGSVLDPCGGSSDVVSQLLPALTQCEVLCNDIDVNVPASSHGDAYRAEFWDSIADPPDWMTWIIGSPPQSCCCSTHRPPCNRSSQSWRSLQVAPLVSRAMCR